MKGGLFLDVVVRQCTPILKLLPSKDQPLLVRWNAFFILDLCLNIVDSVRALNLQCDGLASEGLNKYLHPSLQPQNKMDCILLLDVVIGHSKVVLKLLTPKDQHLMICTNAFLILDHSLKVTDFIGALNLESYGLITKSPSE